MSKLRLRQYIDVWVITIGDPSVDIEKEDVAVCVFQSEKAARERLKEIRNDEDRPDFIKYFIEEVPMLLDIDVYEVKT